MKVQIEISRKDVRTYGKHTAGELVDAIHKAFNEVITLPSGEEFLFAKRGFSLELEYKDEE